MSASKKIRSSVDKLLNRPKAMSGVVPWLVRYSEEHPDDALELYDLLQEWLDRGPVRKRAPTRHRFSEAVAEAVNYMVGSSAIRTTLKRIEDGYIIKEGKRIVRRREGSESGRRPKQVVGKATRANARTIGSRSKK